MRIIEVPKTYTPFSELKEGDVFSYNGEWYLKMIPYETKMMQLNSVNLENGMPIYVSLESAVEYRDVKLEVEEV